MPKKIYKDDPNLIFDILIKFPDGMKLEDILLAYPEDISRRALQRKIAKLLSEGTIIAEGKTRLRRYKLSPKEETSTKEVSSLEKNEVVISKEGAEIQALVRAPIQRRNYVGYNREFLDKYIPNKTFYLDQSTRESLREIGKSPDGFYPAGTFARKIFEPLLIDLSWNSSRLEGNTYSLLETDRLLKLNIPIEGKTTEETQMILNHKEAIEFLIGLGDGVEVTRYVILNLHALLANNLLKDSRACGAVRTIPVGIGKTVYMPLEIPQLLEECFDQIVYKANAIEDPFEQAFFMMVHFPYLQAFEDVNKRVSRLSVNIPFIRANLSPLSFVDVPKDIYISGLLGIYELNRIELMRDVFVWAYKRSCYRYAAIGRVVGEPDPFKTKYHKLMNEVIFQIVEAKMDKEQAHRQIEKNKSTAEAKDQEKFVEVIETELMCLHEGNIARYRVTPKQFEEWQKNWS